MRAEGVASEEITTVRHTLALHAASASERPWLPTGESP